ncbi:NADH-quinone oxidoreductase subunit NuoE [Rickettsiales bacterium]|nr:NADH-quinone oxidoreductase subunit NuoE [Rickettsiales bacterium]
MSFTFDKENLQKSQEIIAKYPQERSKSAVMPLLDLAQRQNNNYISKEIIEYLSNLLDLPVIHIYEVASFYSMYNLEPVGKYLIQVCGTTPCMLCGSKKITEVIKKHLKIEMNQTTKDKLFTLKEVECLGACVNAPMIQINDDYHEKLDDKKTLEILKELKKG